LVVKLAVEPRVDRDQPAVGGELDQTPPALLRAVELAARAVRQPVHAIGIAAKLADRLALGIEVQDQAFVDHAEQDRTVMPDHAAGGPLVGTGDQLEIPMSRAHDTRPYQTGTPGIFSRVRKTK